MFVQMSKLKEITIGEIAKRAGVSKGTVSAVLNEKNYVKPSTRDNILQIMKALNYRPKGVARNLRNRTVEKSIGIIVKELNYPFFTTIAEGAKEYASSRGYSLIIAIYGHFVELQIEARSLIHGAILSCFKRYETKGPY